jgi:hypothetical protein
MSASYLGIVAQTINAGFRPKLYNESIRRTALSLLITQINNGHTHELERALDRWNTIELEIFLRVLVLHSGPSHSYADLFSCLEYGDMYSKLYIQIPHCPARPSVAVLNSSRLQTNDSFHVSNCSKT